MVDSHRDEPDRQPLQFTSRQLRSSFSTKAVLANPWVSGLISAVLLDLPFPVAGPMPAWRGAVAWLALVPLLYALLAPSNAQRVDYLRHSALGANLCGVTW